MDLGALTDVLKDPQKLAAVARDGAKLVEEEVARKTGLRGMALKAGYKTVCSLRPDLVEHALERLLPEFAPQVDPFYETAEAQGPVEPYFRAHASEIADALLGVTDRRAERAQNRVIKRAYEGLRAQAKGHVEEAMPGLARLVARHVAPA